MKYDKFKRHMEIEGLGKSTIYKYSRAIHTISDELCNRKAIDYSIYMIEDMDIILDLPELYSSFKELEEKDIRGHRMYSNALKRYIEFMQNSNETIKEEKEICTYGLKIKDKPKSRDDMKIVTIERIKRDTQVSGNALVRAEFRCEYDNDHELFISKTTSDYYTEAHHLIPMLAYDDFTNSLDVEANIVSLCVCCHKLLHHGVLEDKIVILRKLYDDRIERLKICKIDISFSKLVKYYK